ncbi:DUF484 family protein [Marinibaculum pumilum]|uniref:DUF484 family protein n=1 Tax=Marinibaculum pumilum TaxID=1766165 RepID=A0ABV7L136_9PROT
MSEPQDSKAAPASAKAGAAQTGAAEGQKADPASGAASNGADPEGAPARPQLPIPPEGEPAVLVASAGDAAGRLEPQAVADWLAGNPDFLAEFLAAQPELLRQIRPPAGHEGGNVVDFQSFMIDRLQTDIGRLTRTKDQVIAASRQNASTQRQVHDAVLALLSAASFEHLIHIATADLASILDVDLVTICLESDLSQLQVETPGVVTLPPGSIDTLLGPERRILLRAQAAQQAVMFGPGARLVRSDALVRLTFGGGAPPGLFAFGAREPGRFDAGQGTELLSFLGGVMERCVQAWLDLPRL